tara:strand:- start:691 stop:1257 length:567 start_codon:yes stop_codon:yes gene_type:complete
MALNIEELQQKMEEMERFFTKKIEILENQIETLKDNKTKKKKKKSNSTICKELNELEITTSFVEWFQKIEINNNTIQLLFENSIEDYINLLINNNIRASEEIPIILRDNKLFIHNDDKWELLKNDDINKLVLHIQMNTMKQMVIWEKDLDFSNDKNINKMVATNEKILIIDSPKIIKSTKNYISIKCQ